MRIVRMRIVRMAQLAQGVRGYGGGSQARKGQGTKSVEEAVYGESQA